MKTLLWLSGLLWATTASAFLPGFATSSSSLRRTLLPIRFSQPPHLSSVASREDRYDQEKYEEKEYDPQESSIQLAQAKILKAFSMGVPAYNAGDVQECANIYFQTADEILLETSGSLPLALHDGLVEILIEGTEQRLSADEVAWAFKDQFDAIMEYQIPFGPTNITGTQGAAAVTLKPFSEAMLPHVSLTLHDGAMGGISQGHWNPTTKTFAGTMAIGPGAPNGGFASLKWRFPEKQDWSHAQGIYLNVTHSQPAKHTFHLLLKDTFCEQVGNGADYKVAFANDTDTTTTTTTISSEENPSAPGQENLQTTTTEPTKATAILIPFSEINHMEQMGMGPMQAPPLNYREVKELGIMAIKPSVVGDFELTIHEWGLYV